MKLQLKHSAWLLTGIFAAFLSACSSDDFDYDDYMPGTDVPEGSPQLYFDASNESTYLFTGDDNRTFDITIARIDSTDAVSERLILTGGDGYVSVPDTVRFSAGERTATIAVDCTALPTKTTVNFTLSFESGISTPYGAGSDTYQAKVTMSGDWVILADDVIYQYCTTSNEDKWEPTFNQKLYQLEGTERFKFENFLNSGVDFVFSLGNGGRDDNRTIVPERNFVSWSRFNDTDQYGCWWLFDEDSNSYPQWSPDGNEPTIAYMLFYDTDSSNGYVYTYVQPMYADNMTYAWFVTETPTPTALRLICTTMCGSHPSLTLLKQNSIMNITSKLITGVALALTVALTLTSCSDDETTPLANPVPTLSAGNYCSLSFEWQAVEDAVQYGCTLTNESTDEQVAAVVTQSPRVTFSDLQPATAYRLDVVAYSRMESSQTCSATISLTANTDALVVLAAPQLAEEDMTSYRAVSWPAVTNAKTYAYTLTDSQGATILNGSTSSTSLNLYGLHPDTYRLTVQSCTSEGGFSSSAVAQLSFTTSHTELWSVTGKYTYNSTRQSFTATMTAYSDCSYTIEGFCGVEGYDLTFFYDKTAPSPYNLLARYATNSDGYVEVPTGWEDGTMANFSTGSTSLRMTGNEQKGKFTFTTASFIPDTFAWP